MLCFCNNIPAKIFYASLGAEKFKKLPEPLTLLDYETAKLLVKRIINQWLKITNIERNLLKLLSQINFTFM